jgi:hypothetical protein
MATGIVTQRASAPRTASSLTTRLPPTSSDPLSWPIVYRVVTPAASGHDHDRVICETTDEGHARRQLKIVCRDLPVRLEIARVGPLPRAYLRQLHSTPGPIRCGWTDEGVRS